MFKLTAYYLMPFVSVRMMVTNLVPDGHHQGGIATARSLQKLLSLKAFTSAFMPPSVGRPSVICRKSQHKRGKMGLNLHDYMCKQDMLRPKINLHLVRAQKQ